MSVWTEIEGTVRIPKAAHVSIAKVVLDTFGDEYYLNRNDSMVLDLDRVHTLSINVCLDGQEIYPRIPKFLERLQATSHDLSFTLRFLK